MAMVTLSMALGAPQSDASGPTVVITDSLSPKSVSITPGTTVTWVNRDDKVHRLRAQDGGIEFDSKDLEPGDRWSHTFRDAGTASYHDQEADEDTAYHGKVVVGQVIGRRCANAWRICRVGNRQFCRPLPSYVFDLNCTNVLHVRTR